jgi:O-antigen/teichoic acid export membrane protein
MTVVVVILATRLFDFEGIVVSYYVLYVAVGIVTTTLFFKHRGWSLVMMPIRRHLEHLKELSGVSFWYWLWSIAALFVTSSDLILASQVAGLSEAGDYALIQRLFLVLVGVHFSMLAPLGPAYTHAAKSGNWAWLSTTLLRSLSVILALFVFGGVVIFMLHPQILSL